MPMLVQFNTSQFPKEFVEKYVRKIDDFNGYDAQTVEQIPFPKSLISNPKQNGKGNVIQFFYCMCGDDHGIDNWKPFQPGNPIFFRNIVDDVC